MSGNQSIPEDGNTTVATPVVASVSSLLALALIFFGIRMHTRLYPKFKVAATDYLITAALLCEVFGYTCLMVAIAHGLGRHSYYVSEGSQVIIFRWLYFLEFLAFWTSSLARMSIAAMLLRFVQSRAWKVVLWIFIFAQIAIIIETNVCLLIQCRPIRAMWENVPGSVCWSSRHLQVNGYLQSAIGIISDLTFAIIPIYIIWPLHRPVLERILIIVLMMLGLVAAVAGVIKLYYMRTFTLGGDSLRQTMPLFLWFKIEEIILICAACAPFLKRPIEGVLKRFGVSKSHFGHSPTSNMTEAGTGSSASGATQAASFQTLESEEQQRAPHDFV